MSGSAIVKLGITGGIGAGKSMVCRVLEVLGVPVYYADDRAKWLMNHQPKLKQSIALLFGTKSYREGVLDNRFIAERIFTNQDLIKQMNTLVHPAVKQDFKEWCVTQSKKIIAKETALLFETGSYKELDQSWLVTCPIDKRIKRVKKRDPSRSDQEIIGIIEKQWNDEEKLHLADIILANDDEQLLIPQVLTALSKVDP
ncbi:MAG: dephospho-CoA kinase [Cyclobacteriaceae bacterium]